MNRSGSTFALLLGQKIPNQDADAIDEGKRFDKPPSRTRLVVTPAAQARSSSDEFDLIQTYGS